MKHKHQLVKVYYRDQRGTNNSWKPIEGKRFCTICKKLLDVEVKG